MMKMNCSLLAWTMVLVSVNGFTVLTNNNRYSTQVHLKDSIAEMIDNELLRLQNRADIAQATQAKIQKQKEELAVLPTNYEYNEDFETSSNTIISRRDAKMAHDDPQRYCADRCVTTGNCDVFEDMYSMSPKEVMSFCTECVLSEEEEPCDVPEAMFTGFAP